LLAVPKFLFEIGGIEGAYNTVGRSGLRMVLFPAGSNFAPSNSTEVGAENSGGEE
jgi:hypothetical protein